MSSDAATEGVSEGQTAPRPLDELPTGAHGELLAAELTPELAKELKRLLGKVTRRTWRRRVDALLQPLSGFVAAADAHAPLDVAVAAIADGAADDLQNIWVLHGDDVATPEATADERRHIAAHWAQTVTAALIAGAPNVLAGSWPALDKLPWHLDSPGPLMRSHLERLRSRTIYDNDSAQRWHEETEQALRVLWSFRTVRPVPGAVGQLRAALVDGLALEELLAARDLVTRAPGVYTFTDRIAHDDDGVLHLSHGADDDSDDSESVALCGAQLNGRFVNRGAWLEADENEDERCAVCARRADEIPEAQEDSLAPLAADARAHIRDLVDQTIERSLDEAAAREDVGLRHPAEREGFRRELLTKSLTDYARRSGAASLPTRLDQLVHAQLAKKYVAHWERLDGASVFDPDELIADVLSGQLHWLDETELARYAYLTVCQRSGSTVPGPLKLSHNRVWRLPAT